MSTSEEPLPESIAENIPGAAAEGAELVGISVDAEPQEIVAAINDFLTTANKSDAVADIDLWTDRALPLGCLWGEALARAFEWQWASLIQHDHDDYQAVAIVNPDRSLAIFPFHYCYGCLENRVIPTVLLAFNMLQAGTIPPQKPRGYVNVMDGVRHIIPPE